ncbi:hypothetical protein AB0F17_02395 [Nonomuraea sp. NPDC026600]|uniref:hypothetical protein n=1 Tax=Nonomuraea sp. NPDC026600 TaxID=3155363 RepID=UPI0033CD70B3
MRHAQRYDTPGTGMFVSEVLEPTVGRLAELAGDGQALEFAIGIVGDMATAVAPGKYTLVYLVFNTISNLLTQAEQVACFRNVARHLTPGGRFVIELWVPELRKLPPGQQATVYHCEPGYIGLDTYDVLRQHVVSHHFRFDDSRRAELFRSLGRSRLHRRIAFPRVRLPHPTGPLASPDARSAVKGPCPW